MEPPLQKKSPFKKVVSSPKFQASDFFFSLHTNSWLISYWGPDPYHWDRNIMASCIMIINCQFTYEVDSNGVKIFTYSFKLFIP